MPFEPINIQFQRGKIYNDGDNEPTIADAIAGLQFLAGLRDAGTADGQVNLINMSSILLPDEGAKTIQPSVKDVIALMQYLLEMRDANFNVITS